MSKSIKRRRGTAVEHQAFVGLDGEITVDTTNDSLRVHDNATAGGFETARADGSNIVADTIDINGGTIDGAVIGANVPAAITGTDLAGTSIDLSSSTVINSVLDEDNLASDSATALATQQSIKAYVDSQVGTVDTLSEILANGNTTGANDIDVDAAQKVQFRDAAIYINSSVDGQLDIVADTEIQIAATTVDINGAVDVSGTLGVTGVATLASLVATTADINAGTIDGTVIGGTTAAAGSFTSLQFDGLNPTVTYDFNGSGTVTSADSLAYTKLGSGISTGVDISATPVVAPSWSAATGTVYADNKFRILAAKGNSTDALIVATAGSASGYGDTVVIGNVDVNGVDTKLITGLGINGELITLAGNATATGTLAVAGEITANGGIALGDNDKATFGSSDDLLVYHDGANSYITESGVGNLYLAAGNLYLRKTTGENLIYTTNAGAVIAHHNGSQKLATTATGIDISGTATMDGLTVSDGTETTSIPATADRVSFTGATSNFIQSSTSLFVQPTGDLILNGTGSEIMRLKSSKVGINNSNPATALDVTGTVTADGLTVDGTGLIQANMGAKLEIKSTDNFIADGEVVGSLDFISADYNYPAQPIKGQIRTQSVSSTGESAIFISTTETTNLRDRIKIDKGGDISFYNTAGNSQALFWDASAESLGIGTTSPAYQLDTGTLGHNSTGELLLTGGNNASNDYTQTTLLRLRATSINPNRTIHNDAASVAEIRFNHADNAGNDSSGSISFYTNPNNYNTAAQERMRIDASGDMIMKGGRIKVRESDDGNDAVVITRDADEGYVNLYSEGSQTIEIRGNGNSYFNGGNVGIGTSSPDANSQLHVKKTGANAKITLECEESYDAYINFSGATSEMSLGYDATDNAFIIANAGDGLTSNERMRIDSSGNAIFTKSGGAYLQLKDASAVRGAINVTTSDGLIFTTGASFTERMRIDSSGSLLVGKTADNNAVAGVTLSGSGIFKATRTDWSLLLNRIGSTSGSLALFQYDGGTYGSIGVIHGNNLTVGGTVAGHIGLQFGTGIIYPTDNTGAANDAAVDIGASGQRFKDLYLSGGVVFGTTGGSVSSKTLDDYESGTWTPAVTGSTTAGSATYTIQQGSYTKIGNVVYWQVRLAYTGHTGTGNTRISFPFTSANRYAAGNYSYRDALTVPASEDLKVYIPPSATYIGLYSVALGTDLVAALVLDTAVTDLSISGVCTVV